MAHEKSWKIMKKTILDLYKSVYGLWPTPSPPSPAALKSALLPRPALETTLPQPLETCHCPWEYPAPGMGRMLGVRYHKGWSNGWQQREALTTDGHYVNSHMLIMLIVLIVIYENSSLFVQVTLQILRNQIYKSKGKWSTKNLWGWSSCEVSFTFSKKWVYGDIPEESWTLLHYFCKKHLGCVIYIYISYKEWQYTVYV